MDAAPKATLVAVDAPPKATFTRRLETAVEDCEAEPADCEALSTSVGVAGSPGTAVMDSAPCSPRHGFVGVDGGGPVGCTV